MLLLNVLTAAIFTTTPPATDTTIAVKNGTRLTLENYMGSVALDVWPRDAVRIRARHRHTVTISADLSPGSLELTAEDKWGVPGDVEWQLTLPTWMAASISGVGADISAEGMQGELKGETVKGDIAITRCGSATISSVEGTVDVSDCRGRVEASSVNEEVHVKHCTGQLQVESVNGDVVIENSDSPGIEASSVNGSVISSGPFRDGGTYSFSAHDGDIVIALSEHASAAVTASTYDGEFSAEYPLPVVEKHKRHEVHFTLGSGGASIELESFQGRIRVIKPEHWEQFLHEREAEDHDKDKGDKDKDEDEGK